MLRKIIGGVSVASVIALSGLLVALQAADPPAAKYIISETGEVDGVAPPETDWQMPAEMKKLFDQMSEANAASRKVFEPLTAEEMNFRPGDGSHTPRWNAEHLAGAQAMFFSQLYHKLNPNVPVIDLMPAQKPDKYTARHPQWSGADEAEWMRRVNLFCVRYAGLLEDVELDSELSGGPFKTLKALLETMPRHYKQHTANVVKKFDDPKWPSAGTR